MCLFSADKINQWGPSFREGYTRLGLLKPFFAENAPIFCLTATATDEDIRVHINWVAYLQYVLSFYFR